MSGIHPSDEALQQYVLDPAGCAPEETVHIGSCPDCQDSVASYRLLAEALKGQPAPAFGFDLAAAVITQLEALPQQKTLLQPEAPPQRKQKEGSWLTAVLITLAIVVPAWLFRRSAYFVFTDMPAVFYGMLLITAGIVIGFFLLRLHKKYQDVLNRT